MPCRPSRSTIWAGRARTQISSFVWPAGLGQLAAQLGLSPTAERALRHDAGLEVSHRKWLALADAKDGEVVTPSAAPASSAPAPAATNGAHRPGFTAPG